MTERDDRELAGAAAAGDESAFAVLVDRHVPRLHRWLVATGCGHHDAEDVVQEAFLRAHRALRRYDPRWAFSTWLYTIAHRVRLDLVRRREQPLEGCVHPAVAAVDEPTPAGGLWAVARKLLSDDDYRALWLCYAEDQPPAAVARILGIAQIAARVRLHRARRRLENALRSDPTLVPAEMLT